MHEYLRFGVGSKEHTYEYLWEQADILMTERRHEAFRNSEKKKLKQDLNYLHQPALAGPKGPKHPKGKKKRKKSQQRQNTPNPRRRPRSAASKAAAAKAKAKGGPKRNLHLTRRLRLR